MSSNQPESTLPTSLTLRLDWSEMDEFSHINNVAYFKYVQAARVNYWQQTGIYDFFKEKNIGPMVLSVNCRFIKPLFFPGEVTIQTKTTQINTTSFQFEHKLFNELNECVAEATDVMVMFDFNTNAKHPFPSEFRNTIEKMEGKVF